MFRVAIRKGDTTRFASFGEESSERFLFGQLGALHRRKQTIARASRDAVLAVQIDISKPRTPTRNSANAPSGTTVGATIQCVLLCRCYNVSTKMNGDWPIGIRSQTRFARSAQRGVSGKLQARNGDGQKKALHTTTISGN
jgi:hypothetical protein